MATKKTISDYAAATLAYMDSGKGLNARDVNLHDRHYTPAMADFAAVQTATRLRKYETISAVIAALGPARMVRDASKRGPA